MGEEEEKDEEKGVGEEEEEDWAKAFPYVRSGNEEKKNLRSN